MSDQEEPAVTDSSAPLPTVALLAWAWVVIPLIYGLYELIRKVIQLFTG